MHIFGFVKAAKSPPHCNDDPKPHTGPWHEIVAGLRSLAGTLLDTLWLYSDALTKEFEQDMNCFERHLLART